MHGRRYDKDMDPSDSIRMNVGELAVDPASRTPIVILRDEENRLTLAIWIGELEANAVASELEGIQVSRPQTHDLVTSILDSAAIELQSVAICDIRENTYYAEITLLSGSRILSIDARPSDAIALALRAKCPIWVAKSVLEKSSMLAEQPAGREDRDLSSIEPEKWSDILEDMGPDDFKFKM